MRGERFGKLGVEVGDAAAGGLAALDPAIVVAIPIVEEAADIGEAGIGQRKFGIFIFLRAVTMSSRMRSCFATGSDLSTQKPP